MGAWCVCVASRSLTWFAAFGTTGAATQPHRCCLGVLYVYTRTLSCPVAVHALVRRIALATCNLTAANVFDTCSVSRTQNWAETRRRKYLSYVRTCTLCHCGAAASLPNVFECGLWLVVLACGRWRTDASGMWMCACGPLLLLPPPSPSRAPTLPRPSTCGSR